jgi:endonuclease/exonuclease/phosphatase (EEP) superfamily protein YafD
VQGGLIPEMVESAAAPARSRTLAVTAFWIALAIAHLAAVLLLFPIFALWPKAGWAAFLLYAPRAPLALPALITVLALRGRWRFLPLITAAIVLGPLMGLHLNGPARDGQVRLLTWHVWFGAGDPAFVRSTLAEADPDIVVLQSADARLYRVLGQTFADRDWVRQDQYAVGSRWPTRAVEQGPPMASTGWRAWTRFAIDAPIGTLELLAVHPHSPRALLRGPLRRSARGDQLEMEDLSRALRDIDDADRHGGPLRLVAGDFNAPELAGLMHGLFASSSDAFAIAGNGYGYTFPVHNRFIPWLRIDRVFTGPGLRPTRAEVIGYRGSDHAALLVDFELATH